MKLTPEERRSLEAGDFAEAVRRQVRYGSGKPFEQATSFDLLQAVSLVCRQWAVDRMLESEDRTRASDAKRVYYFSLEFLLGRTLEASLRSIFALEEVRNALGELGVDLDTLLNAESDAGLGNGGLGRLAACYLDSLATRDYAGFGYGINYEHGLFRQVIVDGEQQEFSDSWRRLSSPWLIPRPERAVAVAMYGRAEGNPREGGSGSWVDWRAIIGLPHDMPIVGYGGRTVNWLRLYSAEVLDEMDVGLFNSGDYLRASEQQINTQRISKLLYPSSSNEAGYELRLLQEYFFVSCSVRDVLRRFFEEHERLDELPDRIAIQLNDTHPALAVPEMIRLLVDEKGVEFDRAVELTHATISFTNHTLLPEALESWPRPLLERVIPRHLAIIEELNASFLESVRKRWPGDLERVRRMSIIEESHPKRVRMANLAIVGSHTVNGVSALHSQMLRRELVPEFAELRPGDFVNVTNGVSPRRWLLQANPGLSDLITTRIGPDWVCELEQLEQLEPHLDDAAFRDALREVKSANKQRLAAYVHGVTGVTIDPASLFDVQVKRIHLYKRQLLAALHAIHLYLRAADHGDDFETPRTCIFAGKAAPEFFLAKLVIRLINMLGRHIGKDPRAREQLRVVFVPDYRVSLAEKIVPAADVSEQISTAGHEASGTGNMKLGLNGALTVGTLDGANIEILDAVGEENMYVFGLRAEEVRRVRKSYDSYAYVMQSPALAAVIEALRTDRLGPGSAAAFSPLLHHLFDEGDPYCVLADFEDYRRTQERVATDFRDTDGWVRRAGLNIARMGRFSSDRAVEEYAERIWGIEPVG